MLLGMLLFWPVGIGLSVAALVSRRRIHETAQVLWAIWIVVMPIAGPISYFIVGPGERRGAPSWACEAAGGASLN